jgi:hypothetical protein
MIRCPVPQRGVGHRHERWDGMRWTQLVLKTRALACGRRSRVVLTPRRRRQVCGSNSAGDGDKKARSPGRARSKPLKPLRAGMPGDPGATVVTNACAFYHCTRGCGRNGRPAFPTPSLGRNVHAQLGRIALRERCCVSCPDGLEPIVRRSWSRGSKCAVRVAAITN